MGQIWPSPILVMKIYWNTAMPIHICIVFCAMTTELHAYIYGPQMYMTYNFYYLALHRKSLPTSVIIHAIQDYSIF